MKKLTHFEGLRGIAAFIVFLAHFRPTFCTNINEDLKQSIGLAGGNAGIVSEHFLRIFYEGDLPVYIFWLMSAYVISMKLFNSDTTKSDNYLIEASTKRYFRLAIPVFAASLICFLLLKMNWMLNIPLAEAMGKEYVDGWLNIPYHFGASVFHLIRVSLFEVFINGNSHYNMVLWTMGPEFLGSILCFAMFALIGRNRLRYVVYLLTIVFLVLSGLRSDVTYYFYITFIAGFLWCDVMNSSDDALLRDALKYLFTSRSISMLLLVAGFAVPIYSDAYSALPYNLQYFFAYPVKAIGITLVVHQFGFLRNIFSVKPLRFAGKISFSMYLLHIPILFSVGAGLYLYTDIPAPYKLPVIFLTVTAVLILASILFEKYIDRPSIRISSRIGKAFSTAQKKQPAIENYV